MPLMTMKNTITLLALAGLLSSCVDAPSEPLSANVPNNPLATSFDVLADEQMAANDVERAEEFRWAALSLRAGVTPLVLQVTNNGKSETFDAFVHSVSWATLEQSLRPPLHRSLVAWRRSGDVLQVLLVGMFTDSAPVVHPLSLRPPTVGDPTSLIAGATAAYFERGAASSTWMGIGGIAKVAEHPQKRSSCPVPNDNTRPEGVNCQLTRFGVGLSVEFARTLSRDSRDVDSQAPTRQLVVSAQTVAGVKLVFTCAVPLSSGCN
jgi:hypothetical protein